MPSTVCVCVGEVRAHVGIHVCMYGHGRGGQRTTLSVHGSASLHVTGSTNMYCHTQLFKKSLGTQTQALTLVSEPSPLKNIDSMSSCV